MTDYLTRAQELSPRLIAWRRQIHQHPELGFHEFRTARMVADHLRSLGVEVTTGVGKTGVVGLIEGAGPGPTVLLRADMDALPVEEATGLPFASQEPGLMHACGHDGHTAISMGVAQLLAESSDQWPGRVKILFQPAEEGRGGAAATIADGVLENPTPDVAFALHLWNQFPSGEIFVQSGPLMAGADRFDIVITGKGGHGAQPEKTIDALLVAANAAIALHTIISRSLPPHEAAVLTIGSLHAGSADNIIAEQATLSGTIRTFNLEARELIIRRIEEVLAGVTAAYGASYVLRIVDEHTPAVINDPAAARIAEEAARAIFGAEKVKQTPPLLVSEDMSEILNRTPGCYVLLGAEPSGGARGPHHSPYFDFDEAMLPYAAAMLAATAVRYLSSHSPQS